MLLLIYKETCITIGNSKKHRRIFFFSLQVKRLEAILYWIPQSVDIDGEEREIRVRIVKNADGHPCSQNNSHWPPVTQRSLTARVFAGVCVSVKIWGVEPSCYGKEGEVEDVSTIFIPYLPLSSSYLLFKTVKKRRRRKRKGNVLCYHFRHNFLVWSKYWTVDYPGCPRTCTVISLDLTRDV